MASAKPSTATEATRPSTTPISRRPRRASRSSSPRAMKARPVAPRLLLEPICVTSLGVTGWGGTPYNVSVGGTDFEDTYFNAKSARSRSAPTGTRPTMSIIGSAKSVHSGNSLERFLRQHADRESRYRQFHDVRTSGFATPFLEPQAVTMSTGRSQRRREQLRDRTRRHKSVRPTALGASVPGLSKTVLPDRRRAYRWPGCLWCALRRRTRYSRRFHVCR